MSGCPGKAQPGYATSAGAGKHCASAEMQPDQSVLIEFAVLIRVIVLRNTFSGCLLDQPAPDDQAGVAP